MSWFGTRESGARAKRARHGARRRTRESAAPGRITKTMRDMIWERDGRRCYLCKSRLAREQMTVEHVVALANGGTNEPDNLRAAHRSCNSKKGARTAARRKGLRRGMWQRKVKSKVPEGADVF